MGLHIKKFVGVRPRKVNVMVGPTVDPAFITVHLETSEGHMGKQGLAFQHKQISENQLLCIQTTTFPPLANTRFDVFSNNCSLNHWPDSSSIWLNAFATGWVSRSHIPPSPACVGFPQGIPRGTLMAGLKW